MRSLFFLLLLTFSATVLASSSTSYNKWVKSLPSCMQPCFNDFFTNSAQGKCGKGASTSSKPSDINCICQSGSFTSSNGNAPSIADCASALCPDAASQLQTVQGSYTQLCLSQVNSDGSVPSLGSTTPVSGLDVILASGGIALLQCIL
ncbi:hypothetical protein IFM61606_04899 [Aspergillus udagawae]|uniref:Extracellular membrane protein CFEM domain-containing protein n=1 Tax=Aspergillus udagawae TaxID=91492 RepID=A0A8H3NJZ6_9EURO|nr:uncharacterized protein Aud_007815 [Aspergillus udagawae]GFF31315.1 hypothetical protein IFM51744_01402 [Aspergillus udagawae]GFF78729.1 hypothetical protein IFM53868_02418 [Aspergillus udagawae]GFG08437.1 hypothetical protein IFM5058_03923 [Aspergillus udagawae]GFG24973.1 hypothetical protein IFM61606_04899 [Aspergillus udagawae]GIC91372.1 hypothetical protein Aud_007815 [Aspergillus udagawae]